MKKDDNKTKRKEQQTKKEMNYYNWYMNVQAWNFSGLLTLVILIPYIFQWFWFGPLEGKEILSGFQLIVIFATWFCLFGLTIIIIDIDERRPYPIRLNVFGEREINWTTMGVWLGFIVLPIGGLLVYPRREIYWVTAIYLLMGLVNFLPKLNQAKTFRYWLECSSISQDEVQLIYEVMEIRDVGLYALVGWPWWIIRIQAQPNSGFVINICEPEDRLLVNVTQGAKGRNWRKRYSTIDKAVRKLGIQLRRLEKTELFI
ncbi:MAG: hypothetical protein WAS33_07705 [Candidatus Promineifilaceae bacterium]